MGTHRWGGVAAYCIAVLETEVKILDIELQVRKNELPSERGWRESAPHREREDRQGYSTSSRIFFHIMRVISSPSSSTTGFFTTIFSPKTRKRAQRTATNVDGETSKLSPLRKTRGHDYSRYDGMLLAKPRERAVATNGEKCVRARGSRPRASVRESIVGSKYTQRGN
jgi:hypothetical protein